MTSPADAAPRLRAATVLRVWEETCDVHEPGHIWSVPFAPPIPAPRVERVSPGHAVAVATAADGREAVVWRWYDAVVLDERGDDTVLLWEPAHGEVLARSRPRYPGGLTGRRAYASAGLPGADWWVTGPVGTSPPQALLELEAVADLYVQYDMWRTVFGAAADG